MRILILGAAGMLGHKLWQVCRDGFDTWVTVRSGYREYEGYALFDPQRLLSGVDTFQCDTVVQALAQTVEAFYVSPPAQREAMGQSGQQAFQKRYTRRVLVDRYEGLFQEIVARNRR